MKMIRLVIEGSETLAMQQAAIRGMRNVEVVSHNDRTATTILRVSMQYWDSILEWWKSSEVRGLRRTLGGDEVVQ